MARGINKVTLIGNLGSEPDVRYSSAGLAIARLSIATTESWQDRQSEQRNEHTEWHKVVAFGRLAEICKDYLHKGSKVYVEGSLQTKSWEGKDGVKRWTTEIRMREMQMLDSKSSANNSDDYNASQYGYSGKQDMPPDAFDNLEHSPPFKGSNNDSATGEKDSRVEKKSEDNDLDDDIPF